MKKLIVTVICLLAISFAALPASAQTRSRRNSNYDGRIYLDRNTSYNSDYRINDSRYRDYNNGDSFWDQHRDKITTAGGAAAGALIGSLIGGKRGAVIGALAGGGSAALYTYKIRDNYRRY